MNSVPPTHTDSSAGKMPQVKEGHSGVTLLLACFSACGQEKPLRHPLTQQRQKRNGTTWINQAGITVNARFHRGRRYKKGASLSLPSHRSKRADDGDIKKSRSHSFVPPRSNHTLTLSLSLSHARTLVRSYARTLVRSYARKHARRIATNQPINQSTNQPINQSTNQPINQSTNQPINQSTNQPINQSTNQPINQSNFIILLKKVSPSALKQ